MGRSERERLALDGGPPVRTRPFPSVREASGRRLGEEEKRALARVIDSGRLNANAGDEVASLEREFADYFGMSHAVASSSGTAALHLAVAAVDPEPGDEIITSPLTDAGTVLPIIAQNAVPVFADVEPMTGNLDVDSVRSKITDRTCAIIVVHLFGIPANVVELRALADAHGILLIEDCAQAYLTRCEPDNQLAGTVGHLGCFSLEQSKHITAGDGGLTVTNDPDLARRAKLFGDKAWPRDTDERTHLFFALNYRMTELQAAVARRQLEKLAGVVEDRRARALQLTAAIQTLPGLQAPHDSGGTTYWMYPIHVDPNRSGAASDLWAAALEAEGVPATSRYLQHPLHTTPLLAERRTYGSSGFPLGSPPASTPPRYGTGLCPVAEELVARRLLVLSWNENYSEEDVEDIATALRKISNNFSRSIPVHKRRRHATLG